VVEPFYPKLSEAGGHPPLPLERMLRIYFLQLTSAWRPFLDSKFSFIDSNDCMIDPY
jgi:hypothetical protein